MNVAELIEQLKSMDQTAEVYVDDGRRMWAPLTIVSAQLCFKTEVVNGFVKRIPSTQANAVVLTTDIHSSDIPEMEFEEAG